ncbi:hypothetical protein MtrunA17_Chr7g0243831 [Medicago truncatula]|uniref:F-box protein interaction domain protein n=1 Tax=Medicago truncatula TaxID=3880 RepID=A0A396H1F9_MEDTR|nr:hypothetical protein MtrunA17_Chr7g0243831 [Medicago truncatula]
MKTYKVVAFHVDENNPASGKSEVKVFSLGVNCWRNIQSFPVVPLILLDFRHIWLNDGMYLGGTINWLAVRKDFHSLYEYRDSTHVEQFVILSLDLSTKTYKQLLLPQGFDEMKEYGFHESWSQLFKISYQNLQDCCVKDYYQTVCLYKNGDISKTKKIRPPCNDL